MNKLVINQQSVKFIGMCVCKNNMSVIHSHVWLKKLNGCCMCVSEREDNFYNLMPEVDLILQT